jgi:predicted N-acetyltransferase YhbS
MITNIRPMMKKDKPTIMKILRAAPEFKPFEVAVAEEVINSYLRDSHRSGYYVLVAEVDRLVVGYICYGPTPLTEGTWDIYWVAVAQGERKRGIGGALIASAEDEMRKAQGRLAIIETSSKPEYEKTRLFHNRQGYELIGRIPDFYAPGDDRLILQKRLR